VTTSPSRAARPKPERPSWKDTIARHEKPSRLGSTWQLTNSLVPYFALWGLMVWSLGV